MPHSKTNQKRLRNFILSLLVVLLVPVVWAQNQQPTDNERCATQNSQTQDMFCSLTTAYIHQAETDQQTKWWPPPSVWDIYWPTVGLLFAAGIASWIGLQTLADIKEQTRLAKISAESAKTTAESTAKQTDLLVLGQRAWILVDSQNVPDNFEASSNALQILDFRPQVYNTGKTIAWIKRGFIRYYKVPKGGSLPVEPDYTGQNDMARQTISVTCPPNSFIQPLRAPIPCSEFSDVRQGIGTLYVYGFVDYDILDGTEKYARFCLEYHVPSGFDGQKRGWYIATKVPLAYTQSN